MSKEKFYRNVSIHLKLLITILLQSVSFTAAALSSDQDQPIEVEADYAELDDQKGITIYKGNVIVTQGSMKIDGDIMTVTYNTDGELDTMIVEGKPAHYEQQPDNSTVKDEAEALRMEFYSLKNQLVLIDKALMKQEDLRFTGKRIEYNTVTNKIIAKGNTKQQQNKTDESTATDSRVKIILKQKKKPAP